MPASKPKVIYVMGAGRSGSTILGIALGNCEHVVYAGELHLWLGKGGSSPLRGEERTRFWAAVRERVEVPSELRGQAARELERSAAVLRPRGWRARHRLRDGYRRVTGELFRAVAAEAGATHVVDTSHFPRRALELQALGEIDLYLLFMVRRPQDVVASYSRDDRDFPGFNLLTTNAYLWLTYLLSLAAFLRQPRARRLLVRYEALTADPRAVLQGILAWSGLPEDVPDLASLSTGVAFQGNPLLRSERVAFESQPRRSPPRGARLTALLNLPWGAIFARLGPAIRDRASDAAARRR